MKRPSRPAAALIMAPRQLSLAFDPGPLSRIGPMERAVALGRLTHLLLEAAGVVAEVHDDGER